MKSGKIKKVFTAHILFNRFIAALILLNFTWLIAADDFGTNLPDGFDKKSLNIYLDRADLSRSREEWQRIARQGVEIVTARWEEEYLLTIDLPGDEELIENNKNQLQYTLDTIVKVRFKDWLIDKFFNERVILNPGIIYGEINRANRQYLFETNEDGSLKLDSAGDPLLKKEENLEEDGRAWDTLVKRALDDALENLEGRGAAWKGELLGLLGNDGNGASSINIDVQFTSKLELVKKSYRNELNRIFRMEEKRFNAKRRRDQFSLKKKSEDRSAASVAKNIIEDTKENLSAGIESLKKNIEVSKGQTRTRGLEASREINAEKWREDFERVFEAGMNKWKSAEKELLLNRMEWERNAGKAFAEGEREWKKAYGELVRAKQDWQSELNSIVNRGLVLWQDKEDSLARAIEDSKVELETAIRTRSANLSGQLDGLIEIYIKSANMIKQSDDSIEFWKESKSPESPSHIESWKAIKKKYSQYRKEAEKKLISLYGITLSDGGLGAVWAAGATGVGATGTDTVDATDTGTAAAGTIGLEDGLDRFADSAGIFTDDPLLNIDADSMNDTIFLDNYQAELLKAKAIKEYWDKQYNIALSVYNYARDTSSNRPTEAETAREYQQALSDFGQARKRYEDSVDELKEAGKTLSSVKGKLADIQVELAEREKELEKALDEYNIKLSMLKTENGDYFKKQISGFYGNLLKAHGLMADGLQAESGEETTEESLYTEYFTASRLFELDNLYNSLNDRVFELLTGRKGEGGFPSLAELKALAGKAEAWKNAWKDNYKDFEDILDSLGIGIDDPVFYPRLRKAFDRLEELQTSGAGSDGLSKDKKSALEGIEKLKIESLCSEAANLKKNNYRDNFNEITILTSKSLDKWLNDTGLNLQQYESELALAGLKDSDTYAKIEYLAESADGRYFLKRARVEKQVMAEVERISFELFGQEEEIADSSWLSRLPDPSDGNKDTVRAIAVSIITDRLVLKRVGLKELKNEISETEGALDRILDFFGKTENLITGKDTVRRNLRGLVGEGGYLRDFFSGKSFLTLGGDTDISGLLFKDIRNRRNDEKNSFFLLNRYGKSVPGIREKLEKDALERVDAILTEYGMGSIGPDYLLKINKPDELWKNSGENAAGKNLAEKLTMFRSKLNEATENLPGYVKVEINKLADSVTGFFLLKVLKSGGIELGAERENSDASSSSAAIAEILSNLEALENDLNTSIYDSARSGSSGIKVLLDAYGLLEQIESTGLFNGEPASKTSHVSAEFIKDTVASQVSLGIAKKLFSEMNTDEYAKLDSSSIDEAFGNYLETLDLGDRENGILGAFKEDIIDESLNLVRLSVLISKDRGKITPTDGESETAGVYTLTDSNIDSVYNFTLKEEEKAYLAASHKIFGYFKDSWDTAGKAAIGEDSSLISNYLKDTYAGGNAAFLDFMESASKLYNELATGKSSLADIESEWLNALLPSAMDAEVFHYSYKLKLTLNSIAEGRIFADTVEELNSKASEILGSWHLSKELQNRITDFFNGYKELLSKQEKEIDTAGIDSDVNNIIEETSGYSGFIGQLAENPLRDIAIAKAITAYYETIAELPASEAGSGGLDAYQYLVGKLSAASAETAKIKEYGGLILTIESKAESENLLNGFLLDEDIETSGIKDSDELLYALSLQFGQRVLNALTDGDVIPGTPNNVSEILIDSFLKDKGIDGYGEYLSSVEILNSLKGVSANLFTETLKSLTRTNVSATGDAVSTVKNTLKVNSILPTLFYLKLNDSLKNISANPTNLTDWYLDSAGITMPEGLKSALKSAAITLPAGFSDNRQEALLYSSVASPITSPVAGTVNSHASTAFLLEKALLTGKLSPETEERYVKNLSVDERESFYLLKNALKLKKRYARALEKSVFAFVSEENGTASINMDSASLLKIAEIVDNGATGKLLDEPLFIVSLWDGKDSEEIGITDVLLAAETLNKSHVGEVQKALLEYVSETEESAASQLTLQVQSEGIAERFNSLKERFQDDRRNYRAYLGDYFQDGESLEGATAPKIIDDISGYDDFSKIDANSVDYYLSGDSKVGTFYENEYLEALAGLKEASGNASLAIESIFGSAGEDGGSGEVVNGTDISGVAESASSANGKADYHTSSERDFFNAYLQLENVSDSKPELSGVRENRINYQDRYTELANHIQRVSFFKEKIALIGGELYDYLGNEKHTELKEAIKEDEENINRLEGLLAESKDNWAVAVSRYENAQDNYNDEFGNMEDMRKAYNAANFRLDKAEAINEYAMNPYEDQDKLTDRSAGLSNPLTRLDYTHKRKLQADAVYQALSFVDTDKRKDFGNKSPQYRKDFNDYVGNFKSAIWFSKILSLTAEETAKQVKRVEDARRNYDSNLDEILSLKSGTDLTTREYGLADFYRVKTNSTSLDRFGLDFSLRGTGAGKKVISLKDETDSRGINTKVFANDAVRDMYFYMGGTVEELKKKYGFTERAAEEAFEAYGISKPTLKEDREKWAEDMANFLETQGDSVSVFENWSLARWYYEYTASGENIKEASNASGNKDTEKFWNGIHSRLEPSAIIGNESATVKHVLGKGWQDQLKDRAKAAYDRITSDKKQNELFKFYLFSEDMGIDLNRMLLKKYNDADFKKNVLGRMNDLQISQKNAADTLIKVYMGMMATAALVALIPFVGPALSGGIIYEALVIFGLGTAKAIQSNLTKKNINDIMKAWSITKPEQLETTYFSTVENLTGSLEKSLKLAGALHREEALLSKMEGKKGGKNQDSITDKELRTAILETLKKKGLNLKGFLGIAEKDFRWKDDDGFLTWLMGNYSLDVHEDGRKSVSSLLLTYREIAKDRKVASFERLLDTAEGLREKQTELEKKYLDAKEQYGLESGDEQTSDSDEASMYAELVKSAKDAYEDSIYTERTHQMRLLETSMGLAGELDSSKYESLREEKREALEEIKKRILSLNGERYKRYAEIKENQWNLMWENLGYRKAQWQESIKSIIRKGNSEWNRSVRRLEESRRGWVKTFHQEYTDKDRLWNEKYGEFLDAKNRWVTDTAKKASLAGRENILNRIGVSADEGIKEAEDGEIGEIVTTPPDATKVIESLTGGRLERLLNNARYDNNLITATSVTTDGMLKLSIMGESEIVNMVEDFQNEDKREIEKEILYITATQALKSLREASKNMKEDIDRANTGVKKSLDNTFLSSGYKDSGGIYTKDILTDSTVLNGDQWEHAEIDEYSFFLLPGGLSLDPEKIAGASNLERLKRLNVDSFSTEEIQAVIDGAMSAMKSVMEKVFGKDEVGNRSASGKSKIKDGLFYSHVGEAPVLKTNAEYKYAVDHDSMKQNIASTGSGEMGRIMYEFYRYSLLEGRGWSEYSKPEYDKRIWDDDEQRVFGLDVHAPSIRDVTDMGVSIATMAIPGAGPLIAAAVNLVDDALFTVLDVSGNYVDADIAFAGFGVKALTSMATATVGGVFNGFDPGAVAGAGGTASEFGAGGFLKDGLNGMVSKAVVGDAGVMALMKGAELFTSGAVGSALGAFNYSKEKGWNWDFNSFAEGTFGDAAIAGYLGGALSTGITGGLDKSIYGYTGNLHANAKAFNALVGGLASTGLTYAMTGSGVVNLANFNMFGSPINHGLLEMHFGDGGNYLKLGGAGTDVSLGQLSSGLKGLEAYRENMKIELAGESARQNAVAMRTLYSSGLSDTEGLYRDILNGKTLLAKDEGLDATAKTVDIGGGRKVILLGKKYFEGAELGKGVYLSHEAGRNGKDDGRVGQFAETVGSVLLHSVVAGQVAGTYGGSVLTNQMKLDLGKLREAAKNNDFSSFASYAGTNYDSSADYWKIMKDGRFIDDNRSSLYIETNNGGEFKLWNMDGLTKENSLKLIVNGKGPALKFSEEVNKRMGLYLITNAETTIGEKAFEKLAFNSYKINDKLGYFVDLSIIKDVLIEKNRNMKYLMKAGSDIEKPSWNYSFNQGSFLSIVNEYGTIYRLGINFSYNNTFMGERTPPNLSAASGSVDELKYSMKDMFNIHNKKLTSTGRFDFLNKQYSHDIEAKKELLGFEKYGGFIAATEIAIQYTEGAMQGFKVTKIQLPMWQVGKDRFFSAIKPELNMFINNNGSLTAEFIPHFYNLPEMLLDRNIRNYANYLEMPDGSKKKRLKFFNNWLRGWDY